MITINGKEYYGVIYKIENIISHYIYIGQTTSPRGFKGRYNYHGEGIERVYNYLKGKRAQGVNWYNKHLLRSLEKYGCNAFTVTEVLDTAMSMDELNQKEIFYIEKFDSYHHGFNMSYGGDSMSGAAKPHGKECPTSKSVCQISLDGELIKILDCATNAAKELNINYTCISAVCNEHRKTAGGFVWCLEKDYDPNKDYKRTPQIKDQGRGTKPVVLLSENNEIIQEFYSVISAGKTLGIKPQEVSRICLHKAKTIQFNLKYKDEYIEEQRLNEETPIAS